PKVDASKYAGTIVLKLVNGDWKIDQQGWQITTKEGKFNLSSIEKDPKDRSAFCRGAETAQFSKTPVHGRLSGQSFTPVRVEFNKFMNDLRFNGTGQYVPDYQIKLSFFEKLENLEGTLVTAASQHAPHIWIEWKDANGKSQIKSFNADDYGL